MHVHCAFSCHWDKLSACDSKSVLLSRSGVLSGGSDRGSQAAGRLGDSEGVGVCQVKDSSSPHCCSVSPWALRPFLKVGVGYCVDTASHYPRKEGWG